MSSSSSIVEEEKIEVVFQKELEESSQDPPMSEWSSLEFEILEENKKKLLYEEGLYNPGSGEICAKYIAMSDSAVLRHPYYNYPAVLDPGIKKALLQPEDKIIYPEDGQELYLAVCKEMNICVVNLFYKNLVNDEIDLKYYCVNPNGVRAMALALQYNRIVKKLDFTDNFLNNDACYHLGEMLTSNSILTELNLSGCRIGPPGLKRLLAGMLVNRGLRILNLNKNQLGDDGIEILADAIFRGLDVYQIGLSHNNIGSRGAAALADAFETHNKFTHIDLSWNNLFSPAGTYSMLSRLSENQNLQEVNLSWNSMSGQRLGVGIKILTKAPNLRYLDISNNRLQNEAITSLLAFIPKTKKLHTIDLSYNPMTPKDAVKVLTKLKVNTGKVQNVYMNNVFVDGAFLEALEEVKSMKIRKNLVITYGGVTGKFIPKGTDARDLVLARADYLAMKPKKRPMDVALVVLQMIKDGLQIMTTKEFSMAFRRLGSQLDEDLIEEIVSNFQGPRTPKSKTIDLKLLEDFMKRKWPERRLPPTPPPEPKPEPKKSKGKKGKAKSKK